ncbi:MAG: histidine phosphatase family protein [Clostridia bacterium]|nr:histidine phosphatase family protein [Clostridia bacterium]
MKLLIIRHGDPDYERDALTKKGKREAALLSNRLCSEKIDAFYVSPLGRARDTIQPTLEKLHRQAAVCNWLQEFSIHAEDPCTHERHVIWDYYPSFRADRLQWNDPDLWYRDELFAPLHVELWLKDVWRELDRLLAQYGYARDGSFYRTDRSFPRDQTIAFVCHFGIGSVLVARLLNISVQTLLHSLFLAPTSVTTVVTEEREPGIAQWRCVSIGDLSHLYLEKEPMSRSGLFQEY